MYKYLTYVERKIEEIDIPKQNKDFLLSELRLYKEKYKRYKNAKVYSPIYDDTFHAKQKDVHEFELPSGKDFEITWDIDLAYQKLKARNVPVRNISTTQFNTLFHDDIVESKGELDRICGKIKNAHEHTYMSILGVYFRPFRTNIILDGRHRFVEHLKLKPCQTIPVLLVSSDEVMDCIVYANELTNYIILSNIEEIDSFLMGKGKLEHILNFEKCGL